MKEIEPNLYLIEKEKTIAWKYIKDGQPYGDFKEKEQIKHPKAWAIMNREKVDKKRLK